MKPAQAQEQKSFPATKKENMDNERYVAAIEISSSKIIAAVGRTDGTSLNIIAVEQIKGLETVRFGIIQNAEEAASRIITILDRLEARPEIYPRKISRVFLGIAGRSMRSISKEVHMHLADEAAEVTAQDLEALTRQAREAAIDSSLQIIDVQPRSWEVGSTVTQNPKGMIGATLGATFDLIVCRPVLERNLMRTVSGKLGLEVASVVVSPLAAGHVLVTPEEKRLGCMLVDIGAETTTVVIFKSGHMIYFATLPLGGRNITLDLTSLKILEERADEIKRVSGNAIAPEKKLNMTVDDISINDISNLVSARSEEIAANICEQIHYAGLEPSDLSGGIIAMGGGFKLKGMTELVAKVCNLRLRTAKLPDAVRIDDMRAPEDELLQAGSVLYTVATHTDTDCLESIQQPEMPAEGEANTDTAEEVRHTEKRPKRPSRFSSLLSRVRNAMTYKDDTEDDEME